MSGPTETYLRLFDNEGASIARPDFMVLAAISEPQLMSVEHIYATMLLEEQINPPAANIEMTEYAKILKRNVIDRRIKERVFSGEVVLELVRLAAATGKPPGVNAARRLVAFNHHKHFRIGEPGNIKREVERGFGKFRNTSHFQAAAVLEPSLLYKLEGDEPNCRKFLGIARAFELFMDNNVASTAFKWSPLRVPAVIDSLSTIKFIPLSDQELAVAQQA